MINADTVALQPLISRDANGFQSCGVRVVAMVTAGAKAESYDFSVNAQIEPLGSLLKAGKYRVTMRPGKSPNFTYAVALPSPTAFWIAAVDQSVPLTMTHPSASDSKGFIIGVGDFIVASKLIFQIAQGHQMQFVVRYRSEQLERIVSFAKNLEELDLTTLNACTTGISDRLSLSDKNR